jgi:hypothetical protein
MLVPGYLIFDPMGSNWYAYGKTVHAGKRRLRGCGHLYGHVG